MSKVISLRIRDPQVERLNRLSRRLNRTPSETAAILLDEALRTAEYAYIVFRDSPVVRQAYVGGTGLAVWEIMSLYRAYEGDLQAVATHLELSPVLIQAALNYATDFPEEIEAAIEDNTSYDLSRLSRMFPDLRVFEVESAAEQSPETA